jgi:hypothetical protein
MGQTQIDTNDVHSNYLSVSLLDLLQLSVTSVSTAATKDSVVETIAPQEIPEPRFGDDLVGREDTHAVDLGIRLMFRGEVAADDLKFSEAHLTEHHSSQRHLSVRAPSTQSHLNSNEDGHKVRLRRAAGTLSMTLTVKACGNLMCGGCGLR